MDKKETTKTTTFAKPTITPVNQRILCLPIYDEVEKRPGSNIWHLPKTLKDNKAGENIKLPRFIVMAAAMDCEMVLQIGDEVFPFWPEEAIGFTFPTVRDSGNKIDYTTLHWTELAAFKKEVFEIEE